MPEAIPVSDRRAILGESPVWSAEERAVYWVDIPGRELLRTDPATGETRSWAMPSCPGMVALRERGGLVVALEDGIHAFDPDTGRLDRLVEVEADQSENRANDGKCDAGGRLWVGTINMTDSSRETGSLYRIDRDLTVSRIETGFRVPNGLAWSPDNRTMYHTDSRKGAIHSFDFDLSTGTVSRRRPHFRFDRATMGAADGAAMDSEGYYWAVLYGGGRLIRLAPDGRPDREIPLPVSQPTMPAFGGADMRTIFITSSSRNLDEGSLTSQPDAGCLFAVEVDVRGLEVHPFGG